MLAERRARPRQRRREPRPVLGDPGRRRQLRRRHLVPVPPARGRHGVAGPTFWAVEQGAEVLTRLPRLPPERPARAERLLRLRLGAAGAAVPRGAAPAQGLRRRLVLRRATTEEAAAAMAPLLDALPEPLLHGAAADAAPGAAGRLRPGLPGGRPVVLARRLRQGDPRRGGRGPRQVRRRDADLEVDHAPVPDRRRRPRRRADRHALEPTATPSGARCSPASTRTPPTRTRSASWSVDYFEALHPYSAGGAYVNMMMDEGQERVRASYGDNYDRLAQIKAEVRPGQPLPRQPEHPAADLDPAGPIA